MFRNSSAAFISFVHGSKAFQAALGQLLGSLLGGGIQRLHLRFQLGDLLPRRWNVSSSAAAASRRASSSSTSMPNFCLMR